MELQKGRLRTTGLQGAPIESCKDLSTRFQAIISHVLQVRQGSAGRKDILYLLQDGSNTTSHVSTSPRRPPISRLESLPTSF